MPIRWSSCIALSLALLGGCDRCNKKEETDSVDVPPPPGGASADIVATNIGSGLGLPADLAPTSTEWRHAMVLGGDTAVLVGRVQDQAIAIRTTDKGRTWVGSSSNADAWQSWGASADGNLVLVSGPRKKVKPPPGMPAAVESARAWFAPSDGNLSEPVPFFPNDRDLVGVDLAGGVARPAVLDKELASMVVTRGRAAQLAFVAPAGKDQPKPVAAPGQVITAPYGRPAQLLSVAGGTVQVRAWPQPGEAIDPGSPIPGLRVTKAAQNQLDAGPGCDAGAWSFQRLTPSPNQSFVLGVSDSRAFGFAVPAGEGSFGCSEHAVVVESFDKEKKEPQLVRCTLDGKCATPKSMPFQIWPEEHERKVLSTTTAKGVVAIMSARAGAKWGTYLAQSADEGATFELPRIIGEGKMESGYYDPVALFGFSDRVVLLLSAPQTGTAKRRWYVLASDDGGSNWGPP